MFEEVFDSSVDRWTKSISFMGAFARGALSSLHIRLALKSFVDSHMHKAANE